jgi:hypothetical protein
MNLGITQDSPWKNARCGMSEFKMQFGVISNFPSYALAYLAVVNILQQSVVFLLQQWYTLVGEQNR